MELSWLTKIKITAALAVSILLLAVVAWPAFSLPDTWHPIMLHRGIVPLPALLLLAVLGAASAVAAYFIAWPYGPEVAPLAIPAGLGVLSLRGGNIGELFQMTVTTSERAATYMAFAFEAVIWLLLVLMGFAIAKIMAKRIFPASRPNAVEPGDTPLRNEPRVRTNAAIALAVAAIIMWFAVGIFVRSIATPLTESTSIFSQPRTAQIVFGVAIAAGIAAFATKLWFNFHAVIALTATGVVSIVAMLMARRPQLLAYMAENWPANSFVKTAHAITPLQLIAFGAIGAVVGYWLAIRFNLWRATVKVV